MEFIPPAPFGFSRLIKVKPIYPTKAPSIPAGCEKGKINWKWTHSANASQHTRNVDEY